MGQWVDYKKEEEKQTGWEDYTPAIMQTSAPERLRIEEAMRMAGITLPTEDPDYAKYKPFEKPLQKGRAIQALHQTVEPIHSLVKSMAAPVASSVRQLAGRVMGEQPEKAAEAAGGWAESVMGFGGYPTEESELTQNLNELLGQAGKGFEDVAGGISSITGLPKEDVLAAVTALTFVIPVGMEAAYYARVRSGLRAIPKGERVTGNRLMSELIDSANDLKIITPDDAARMKPTTPAAAPKTTVKGTVSGRAGVYEGITYEVWKDIKYKTDLIKNEPMHPKVPEYMKELSDIMAKNKITESSLQEGMRLSELAEKSLRELTPEETAGVFESRRLASESLRKGEVPPEVIDRPTKSMAPDGQLVNETMKLAPDELAGDASSAIAETSAKAANPWELTQKEFDATHKQAVPIVQTKEGVIVRGTDHGDAFYRAQEAGYTFDKELGQVAGWKVGKTVLLDKNFPEGSADFLHKGIVRQSLSEGKFVPPEVLVDYPDLAPMASRIKPPPVDVPEITHMYAGIDLRQALIDLGVPIDAGLKTIMQQARENFHSPLWVLEKYAGDQGVRIYNRQNFADLAKAKWVDKIWDKFKVASKGLGKDGSFLDTAVARVRDTQLLLDDVVKMTPDEYAQHGFSKGEITALRKGFGKAKKWWDFQEEYYDVMMRDYGKSVLTPERETMLWKAAKKNKAGKPPTENFLSKLTENEKTVWDVYKRRIENYMPHLFDRSELIAYSKVELTNINKAMTKVKPGSKAYEMMDGRRAKLAKTIENLQGGAPLMWDIIPESVNFKFFQVRRGMTGYNMSSKKAFRAYLNGIAKKIFDEPALRANLMEYNTLPENVKPYTQWYMREYMGYNNTPLADLWGNIKSLMWIKTLGFNPRSAIVNLTQRLNTIADAGPLNSIEGYRRCFTREGRALFEESGLAKQVPTALMEHGFTGGKAPATPLEFLREASGWMFSRIEKGNLKHALLSNDTMLKRKGVASSVTRLEKSIEGAQKVQFRYGRVGTPKVLRGPGGVAFQFWSYPIKQIELMSHWAKTNPMKLVAWLAAAEGGRRSLSEFLDIDLSSALGVVTNYGELISMFRALPDGDLKKIWMHGRAAGVGGGVAPYGLGPAVQSAQELGDVVAGEIPAIEGLMNMAEPLTMQRVRQDIRALAEGADEAGEFPVREKYGPTLLYKEDPKELFTRVFLGRPAQEMEVGERATRKRLEDMEATKMIQEMAEAIVAGEPGKAMEISTKYKLPISKASIKNAYLRYMLTKDQRMLMDELRSESRTMFREYMRK